MSLRIDFAFRTPWRRELPCPAVSLRPKGPGRVVIDHYNKGDGLHNPFLDQDIQPLALSEADIDSLVAFMASLTSADLQRTRAQKN
jgi:hypothetical protein